MDHFVIYDSEHPAPLSTATHFSYDEGSWRYVGTGIKVFAFEDDGEQLEVFVAAKRRYGTVELMDELTYDNLIVRIVVAILVGVIATGLLDYFNVLNHSLNVLIGLLLALLTFWQYDGTFHRP